MPSAHSRVYTHRVSALYLAVALGPLATHAWGQSVIAGGFPDNWDISAAPPAVPTTNLGSGIEPFTSVKIGTNDNGLLLLGGSVKFRQESGSDSSFTSVVITREQTFTLVQAANVALPTFLTGTFNIGPGSNATPGPGAGVGLISFLAATGNVNIYNAAGTSVLAATVTRKANQMGTEQFTYVNTALPAGNYKVRSVLTLAAEAPKTAPTNPATFTEVKLDFTSGTRNGLATSLAAYPGGLADSRAAVKAPQARQEFGVTGAGVIVGLMEIGEVYTTHTFLAGRVTAQNPAAGAAAGNFDSEHALAVAGIIAANPGNAGPAADRGIAPGASIRCASFRRYHIADDQNLITDLYTAGARVINFSGATGGITVNQLNTLINAREDLTFVKSAGNSGGAISSPGLATNIITVGALNRDFTRRAAFSSFNGLARPTKPDLVAPGEYINSLVSRDINGDNLVNDTQRHFLGDDYNKDGPTVGDITGTSFSAPHVAGAAALLHELAAIRGGHDRDWRVIKAVLLNSTSRTGIRRLDGVTNWQQGIFGSFAARNYTVMSSLDIELGAGLLDAQKSLRNYFPNEVRVADNNAEAHLKLDAQPTVNSTVYHAFWDDETVAARVSPTEPGTVDYLLEDITLAPLRATLVFGSTNTGVLANLELRLYKEGVSDNNERGFGMGDGQEDFLIATTVGLGESVKLFDFTVPDLDLGGPDLYYLQVRNTSTFSSQFGIAVFIPEPGALFFFLVPAVLITRRPSARLPD